MKVLILFGGKSTEYEISCLSAANVIENIKDHEVTKIGITKDGKWFFTEAPSDDIRNGKWTEYENIPASLDLSEKVFMKNGEKLVFDVAFPVLHGKNGEDGTVQGLFELLDLPYVGPGVLSSAVCMDKITANVMFEKAGLRHVAWDFCTADDFFGDPDGISERFSKLGFPVFIKPSNAGSSVGITKCRTVAEIKKAIETAIPVDSRILAEHGLENIREIEVGVMGDGDAGEVGEVKSACEVYDYDSKYNNPESKTEMPADLPEELRKEVENSAKKAYRACACKGLSRVDFFLDAKGDLYINEINTIPGFTSISMFPMSFKAKGLSYAGITDRLLCLAVKEHRK